jgi:hypothetical protein
MAMPSSEVRAIHGVPGAFRAAAPRPRRVLFGSGWEPENGILATRLSGLPTREDVVRWEAGLRAALADSGTASLRILVDLHGYDAVEVPWDVHRRQREVVPRLLRALGHLPGVGSRSGADRPPRVLAVAHVHHDRDRMALYEATLASASERYFSDHAQALAWLRAVAPGPARAPVAPAGVRVPPRALAASG